MSDLPHRASAAAAESGDLSPADLGREVVLQNNVIIGSVNANRRHFYRGAEALVAADRDWLARLITRRVPPKDIGGGLERGLATSK